MFIDAANLSHENLEKLRGAILKYGESYPEYGEKIPLVWMRLHEGLQQLRKRGKRVIQYSELEKANEDILKGECLSKEQLELFLQFQHNSGYLLYFNDPNLKHLIVLDPKLIIDATKCIVTCPAFALDVWGRKEWQQMVATGKIQDEDIKTIWRKRDRKILYKHSDYLLLVLRKLDIITRPKVYVEGFDQSVSFYYVPSMLQKGVQQEEVELSAGDITMSFCFRETTLLPPAIYNRFVAACISLWQIEVGTLCDGMVALRSGPHHIIVIQRQSGGIAVSVRHRTDAAKIDSNLVRSLRHFSGQTLQRIISLYNTRCENDTECFYQIEYNENAISRGIRPDDERVKNFN